jgi:hypothetical protein
MKTQSRVVPFLLAFLLVPTGQVCADVGFPQSDVTPRFRFENLADYPDHDFYLKYGHGPGNPGASMFVTKVGHQTTVALEGKGPRVTPVVLLAVPHGQPVPEPSRSTEWIPKSEDGVLQSRPLNWSNGSIALYRVSVEKDQLHVTANGSEWLPREWVGSNLWIVVPAGVALSLAFALTGLWVVLRRRARKAQAV